MGLDISAYSKLEFVEMLPTVEAWEEKYYFGEPGFETEYFWSNDSYRSRAEPIITDRAEGVAIYRVNGESDGFRAGSYSGYNLWREQLALMATGLAPQIIWDNPERYTDAPFFLLINFSDCEGTIGSNAAKVLAQQFAEWQPKADAHPDEWFRDKYVKWRRAFDLAADNGAVKFH